MATKEKKPSTTSKCHSGMVITLIFWSIVLEKYKLMNAEWIQTMTSILMMTGLLMNTMFMTTVLTTVTGIMVTTIVMTGTTAIIMMIGIITIHVMIITTVVQ